jgi:hypothetical protein
MIVEKVLDKNTLLSLRVVSQLFNYVVTEYGILLKSGVYAKFKTTAKLKKIISSFGFNVGYFGTIDKEIDLTLLSACKRVQLSGNMELKDISALRDIPNLNLSGCDGITDVSALGGVTNLNLSECRGITDVSALGGVPNLTALRCQGIKSQG